MAKNQYTYAVARIRSMEVSLFSQADIEQLLACRDEKQCLQLLQEKGWGNADTPSDAEAILTCEREKTWAEVGGMIDDMSVFDVLSYPDLFHNLKAAIKMVASGTEIPGIFISGTRIPAREILDSVKNKEFEKRPDYMAGAAREAYETLLHTQDGQLCDIMIDRAALEAVYQAGETLDFLDKLDVDQGDTVVANDDNTFTVNGEEVTVRPAVAQAAEEGTLTELPSTREAFSRFAMLVKGKDDGLGICPAAKDVTSSAVTWFNGGRLAFCVEEYRYAAEVDKAMSQRNNEWGIAPQPVYKTYDSEGNVEKEGKLVAHSLGYGIAINQNSRMKDEAWKFVSWMADEGQEILAQNGYFSSHSSDAQTYLDHTADPNAEALSDINAYSQPGDWWYMTDRSWIDEWAEPLNSQVRSGTMSLADFFANFTKATNDALAKY